MPGFEIGRAFFPFERPSETHEDEGHQLSMKRTFFCRYILDKNIVNVDAKKNIPGIAKEGDDRLNNFGNDSG